MGTPRKLPKQKKLKRVAAASATRDNAVEHRTESNQPEKNEFWQALATRPGIQAAGNPRAHKDIYEVEAERVADRVMNIREPASQGALQKGDSPGETDCKECGNATQRQARRSRKSAVLQMKPEPQKSAPAKRLHTAVGSLSSGGQALHSSSRQFFERRMGHDFGHVRVHTGRPAADAARGLNARAFTTGSDIVFGSGEYRPESRQGQRLLAHELTHVVQQTGAAGPQSGLVRSRAASGRVMRQEHELPPIVLDPGGPPMPRWSELVFEVRSATGTALSITLHLAWEHLDRHRELAQREIDEVHNVADRVRAFLDCPDTSADTLRYMRGLVGEIETLQRQLGIEDDSVDEEITRLFESVANSILLLESRFAEIDEGILRGCLSTAAGPFIEGLQEGLQALEDAQLQSFLRNLTASAALSGFVPTFFAAGATIGIGKDIYELLKQIFGFVTSPVESARKAIESLEAFGALLEELSGLQGAEVARELGRNAGAALVSEIGRLNATSGVIEFSFELGKIIGPAIVYTVLSLLGFEALVAGRLILWSRRALDKLRAFRSFARLERLLPDPPGNLPDVDVPATRTLRRADLDPEWRDVLTDNDVDFLNGTRDVDSPDLPDDRALQELAIARRGPSRTISEGGYVERIDLPNGHHWQRRQNPDGTTRWCRFTRRKCLDTDPDGPRPGETGTQYERRIFRETPLEPDTRTYRGWRSQSRGDFSTWFRYLPQYIRRGFGSDLAVVVARAERVLDQSISQFISTSGSRRVAALWDQLESVQVAKAEELFDLVRRQRELPVRSAEFRALQSRIDGLQVDIDEINAFRVGKVGDRQPDQIELFPDESRAVVTDITLKPNDPWHNFKSLFYRDVVKEITRWDNVVAIEFRTAGNQVMFD